MRCDVKTLGILKDKEVIAYELINNNNMKVTILNYGGIIKEILVPDRKGNLENIVLSFKDINSYENCSTYLGAILGRTAGRIYKGMVTIDGVKYNLPINNGENNIHGGIENFSRIFWDAFVEESESKIILKMKLLSKDMEEGFPGNLDVEVKYILENDNTFTIEYYAKSDKDTLVNLTNHAYFNLSGNNKESIENQYLQVNADRYYKLSGNMALSGEISNVEGTPFDFRNLKKIGKDINKEDSQITIAKGYDHPWALNETSNKNINATLCDEKSGRVMDISTDSPVIVIYTQNYGEAKEFEDGTSNETRRGISFETQNPTIGVNEAFKEASLLKSGEEFRKTAKFKFFTMATEI